MMYDEVQNDHLMLIRKLALVDLAAVLIKHRAELSMEDGHLVFYLPDPTHQEGNHVSIARDGQYVTGERLCAQAFRSVCSDDDIACPHITRGPHCNWCSQNHAQDLDKMKARQEEEQKLREAAQKCS